MVDVRIPNRNNIGQKHSSSLYSIKRFFRIRSAVLGIIVLFIWLIIMVTPGSFTDYDPLKRAARPRLPPNSENYFGTDNLGRDVYTRVLYGSRTSIFLGLISVSFGLLVGTSLGLFAGYFSGLDSVIMRLVDTLMALPSILLAMVIIAAIGPSIQNVMIAVGIASIPLFTRVVRGRVLTIRKQDYIDAAKVLGCGSLRIISRHIFPNIMSIVIVIATVQIGTAILAGSSLSFLGMGAQPPTPEWGLMTAEGRDYMSIQWWISTFPGLAILTLVMAFNLTGDGLRIIWDPRMRID